MKKLCITMILVAAVAIPCWGANFSPTILKLNAPSSIQYDFDGKNLLIPVTVSGKPAQTVFMVFTKDKAASIGTVKNGYLGWHYVNKIDTCVYMSQAGLLGVGKNNVTWNGKDDDGALVPAGTYTYYLWAFDSQSTKELAIKALDSRNMNCIETRDAQGLPLANPVMYISRTKWPMGIDPQTASKDLEKTTTRSGVSFYGYGITLDPTDHSKFFQTEVKYDSSSLPVGLYFAKYKWVPNGTSTLEPDWGDQGLFTWNVSLKKSLTGGFAPGAVSDGKDFLYTAHYNLFDPEPLSQLVCVDITDGSQVWQMELSDYIRKDDFDKGGQMNGGPTHLLYRNGYLYANGQKDCMTLALDPTREQEDRVIWTNGNGDYVRDYNFDPTVKMPWVCNDYNVAPYVYSYSVDANNFGMYTAYGLGSVTFALLGPDGTGVGYFGVAGETTGFKWSAKYVDEDTAYDGLYMDNTSTAPAAEQGGTWFLGHDSIKGLISNQVSVKGSAPAAFSVSQNVPNPFNPTTTISFTLAKPGQVSVEVFNAAGQKVATLLNGYRAAGNHSAVWNAGKLSAGVYFYTVKSGNYSKTMKMTLLK